MTGSRIPLEDMKGIIARALEQGDYEHDCEWTRPDNCPCHGLGLQRCTQYDGIAGKCEGYPVEVPTPEQHLVNAEILNAALPEPDADGTVDTEQAARSVLSVINDRLSGDYILRAQSLTRRLAEQAELYEQAHHVPDEHPEQEAGPAPRCQVCSKPLPAGSKASRRTCSDRCRQQMKRMKGLGVSRQVPGNRETVTHPGARGTRPRGAATS